MTCTSDWTPDEEAQMLPSLGAQVQAIYLHDWKEWTQGLPVPNLI